MSDNKYATVIRDEKTLSRAIADTHVLGNKYLTQLHALAVSSLNFAAQHGRPEYVSKFYEGLSTSHQTVFKAFVRKNCGSMVTIKNAEGESVEKYSGFMNHTNKDGWAVVKGQIALREQFMKDAEILLKGKPFHDKEKVNNDELFTDENILRVIDGLIKKSGKDNADISADNVVTLTKMREALKVVTKAKKAA